MENNSSKVIVVGVVGHIPFDKLIEFEHLLNSLPYFRLIRKETSNDKLWIMKSKGGL